MQFIDLKKQYERIEKPLDARFKRILSNTAFIMGEEVFELEKKLGEYVGVKHCISCSSGTDALVLALMAMDIKKGDGVFVPSFTFFASGEAPAFLGAEPIFVDVKEDTFNMDTIKLEETIKAVLKEGRVEPKAIISVDIFGLPAEYEKIEKIAQKYSLAIIEDGAQSFGGAIGQKRAGSFGQVGTTSFFPAKPLGCYGDGGAIFTDDDALADTIKSMRIHGQGENKYENIRLGINGRLDTLQAAVLLEKLKIFDEEIILRGKVAREYEERLEGYIKAPKVAENITSAWAQYTLIAKDTAERDQIIANFTKGRIPSAIYYQIPLHKQKAFEKVKAYGGFEVCESLSQRVFSIPMHPYLTEEEIYRITVAIKEGVTSNG